MHEYSCPTTRLSGVGQVGRLRRYGFPILSKTIFISSPPKVVACIEKDDSLLSFSVTATLGVSPGKLTVKFAVISVL